MNITDNARKTLAVVAWAGLLSAQCINTANDIAMEQKLEHNQDEINKIKEENKKFKETQIKKNKELEEKNKELQKKIDEQAKKLLEVERAKAEARKEFTTKGEPITLRLSFYGGGAEENGGYAGITCTGEKLKEGMVASNVYPLGTKFMWNNKVYTVSDTGGNHFDSYDRLDVYVPRLPGEDKNAYDKRISDYGRQTVQAIKMEV